MYEAVVRDMLGPDGVPAGFSQLVFDEGVLTDLGPGADIESCKQSARKNLRLERGAFPYNSLVDKLYRLFTGGEYDLSLRNDTLQDFLQKSCTDGRLSQTFHTDLPKRFIAPESVHFRDEETDVNDPKSYKRLFPGAIGIISFSHVGFDRTLHQAIVSTSYVWCGFCGTGSRYVLRKKSGRWEVVNKWIVWES